MNSIPVFKPLIQSEEIAAATESLHQGWLGMGKSVGDFENGISKYLDLTNRHVVAVSTGHAALHLSLLLCQVGQGDEVITPSFNNIADFQAILAVGANPVFCDVFDDSLCMNVNQIEELISKNTKAIIVTDFFCHIADHDRLQEIAKKHNLRIIHDASHSFGSTYKTKKIGSFSDITIFSFDPVKTLTTIDGGAIIVRSEEEVKKLEALRLIGMGQPSKVMYKNERAWTYDVNSIGFRYHMANLHASIGLAQLNKMEKISKSRNLTAKEYSKSLSQIKGIQVPNTDFNGITPFLYYIRVNSEVRGELRDFLKNRGVDTGIHWQPGHWFTLFKNMKKGDLKVTENVGREIVSLPFHSLMNENDLAYIVENLRIFFEELEMRVVL